MGHASVSGSWRGQWCVQRWHLENLPAEAEPHHSLLGRIAQLSYTYIHGFVRDRTHTDGLECYVSFVVTLPMLFHMHPERKKAFPPPHANP